MDKAAPAIDFSDLDYLPGDDESRAPAELTSYLEDSAKLAERTLRATNKQRVEHPCGKCRGTGTWVGGYHSGPCFACHGTGKILRAANYEKNKAARDAREQKRRDAAAAEYDAQRQARIDAFKVSHPQVAAWLGANRAHNNFAASLCETVATYGNLSVGQEAAVLKALGRDQLAEAQLSTRATDLDVSSLKGYYAVPDGETRLKIAVRHPGTQSKYHGWVFVDDGAEYGSRQNYGKQAPGSTYRGRLQEQLKAILADPLAAQVAYGRLTGVCGVCGRKLEDEQSVAAGIGPICAAKFG